MTDIIDIPSIAAYVGDPGPGPGVRRSHHCERCGPGHDDYVITEVTSCGLVVLLCYPHVRDWQNALLAEPKKREYELLRHKMQACVNGATQYGTVTELDAIGNELENAMTSKFRAWLADVNPITEAP